MMIFFEEIGTPADKGKIILVMNFSFPKLIYLVQNESWVKKKNTGLFIFFFLKKNKVGLKAEAMTALKLRHFTGLTKF